MYFHPGGVSFIYQLDKRYALISKYCFFVFVKKMYIHN